MTSKIDRASEVLADSKETWVRRRDAAEYLGNVAKRALDALKAQGSDPDTDVRMAAERALREAQSAPSAAEPGAEAPKHYSLAELAGACEKPGERSVESDGHGYIVEVEIKGGRRQDVRLDTAQRKDGVKIVRVITDCADATPDTLSWALRTNTKIPTGAIGIITRNGVERLVLSQCILADEAAPRDVIRAVKAIAFYGDMIEKKLTGLDEF